MPDQRPETDEPDETRTYERRAPRWRLRCLKCGFSEPFGKFGVRLGAASWRKFVIGRCTRCGRWGCMAVERTGRTDA